MEDDEACITGLSLGLGMGGYSAKKQKQRQRENKAEVACLDLTFELCSKGEAIDVDHTAEEFSSLRRSDDGQQDPNSNCENTDSKNSGRKKLRLTKEQSAMLEDSFKLHSALNPAQKQALAEQLNLKPRQVEVWFQNRRARTKLKQTEVDCEFLKKWCENLTDENRRLKRELQELRALKVGPSPSPLYFQISKAKTLTVCSSCEKLLNPNANHQPNYNNAPKQRHP